MKLYNTLSRTIEQFEPLHKDSVTLYTCGPTVYDYTHIGHIRKYTMDDVLKRALQYGGYNVKHVENVTDVGHLVSDEDAGEDKMEKGAKKSGETVWEVADFYTQYFLETMRQSNVLPPDTLCKATDHIAEMIALIKRLEEKGFAYNTDEAIYFNVTKFANYGKLSGQLLEDKLEGAREEVNVDPQKKYHADFALWFKTVGRFKDHTMHWTSPWGNGFPGWHIECSAMSMKYLGDTIDIHTGGVDHIAVHHENEIAQSEAATGKQFVKYWVHHNFLNVEGEKMSKSLGNFYTIDDVKKNGINPLSLRLLFLQTHYRQPMNFTWESAKGASEAYKRLKETVLGLKSSERTTLSEEKLTKVDEYLKRFMDATSNDLQMPQAVAVMWEVVKSNIPSEDKYDLLVEFDRVFGLRLSEVEEEQIPEDIKKLAEARQQKRVEKKFEETDSLRKQIEERGYTVEDNQSGYKIKKK